MAPECLKDNKEKSGYLGQQADVWALGVTFYCLIYLKLPFKETNLL